MNEPRPVVPDEPGAVHRAFRRALRAGIGRAFRLQHEHPELDFGLELLRACARPQAYDPQVEGHRAEYLARLIDASRRPAWIRARVRDALLAEHEDCWALDQLYALAAIDARRGDGAAREALLARFRAGASAGCGSWGIEALLEVEGLAGLELAAQVRGAALAADEDDSLLQQARARFAGVDVEAHLRALAASDEPIRAYLERVDAHRERLRERPRRVERPFDYAEVRRWIDRGRSVPGVQRLLEQLDEADLARLADDLERESVPDRQRSLLRLFTVRRYPRDPAALLRLATSLDARDERRFFALRALRFFEDPRVRRLALEAFEHDARPEEHVILLLSNYAPGDAERLTELLARSRRPGVVHLVVTDLVEVLRGHADETCRALLLQAYEVGSCGTCRRDVLELLANHGGLIDWLIEEMEDDSFEAVRELARSQRRSEADG